MKKTTKAVILLSFLLTTTSCSTDVESAGICRRVHGCTEQEREKHCQKVKQQEYILCEEGVDIEMESMPDFDFGPGYRKKRYNGCRTKAKRAYTKCKR